MTLLKSVALYVFRMEKSAWVQSSWFTKKIDEWTAYCEKFGDKKESIGYLHGQAELKKLNAIRDKFIDS